MTLVHIVSLAVLASTVFATSYVEFSESEEFRFFLAEHHEMSSLRSDLMTITADCNSLVGEFNQGQFLTRLSSGAGEIRERVKSRMLVISDYHLATSSIVSSGSSSQLSALAMNLVANNRGGIEHFLRSTSAGEEPHDNGRREKDFVEFFWPQDHGVSDELLSLTRNITRMLLANPDAHTKVLRIMKNRFILKQKVVSVFAETTGNFQALVEGRLFSRVTWDEVERGLNGDVNVKHLVMTHEVTSLLLLGEKRYPALARPHSKEVRERGKAPVGWFPVSPYPSGTHEQDQTPVKEYPIPSDLVRALKYKIARHRLDERNRVVIRYFCITAVAVFACAAVSLIILTFMVSRSRAAEQDAFSEKLGYSVFKE